MTTNLNSDDIHFLDSLATRISEALYAGSLLHHGKKEEPYLTHDDYDRLRKLAKEAKLADWDRLNAPRETKA